MEFGILCEVFTIQPADEVWVGMLKVLTSRERRDKTVLLEQFG
jgi:hypothetical protein